MSYNINVEKIRQQASGRWLEIIPYVCPGLFEEALANLGQHVDCPLHGGDKDFRFIKRATSNGRGNTAQVGAGMCSCGPFTDGFALLQRATGKSFYGVLKEVDECLNGTQQQAKPPRIMPVQPVEPTPEEVAAHAAKLLVRIANLWNAGKSVDLKDIPYYQARGIDPRILAEVTDVRFMASLGYFTAVKRELVKLGSYPAMLALMRNVKGDAVAVHRTWLSSDKKDKAPVESAKKLSESPGVSGAAIRLFDAAGSDVLGLTEGIETALAVRQLAQGRHWPELGKIPVWACFAERNVRSFQIPAELLNTLTKVVVFADNDESNKGLEAAQAFKERMALDHPNIEVVVKLPPVVGWDWLDALINL